MTPKTNGTTKTAILILCVLLFCTALAQAEPITIQIGGYITFVGGYDAPESIQVGSYYTGTYVYNSSTIDSGDGTYQHDAPYGFNISLGGYEFKTAPNHTGQFIIYIRDDYVVYYGGGQYSDPFDKYSVQSFENASIADGIAIDEIRLGFTDSSHEALSSSDLPVTTPVLSAWDSKSLEIYGPGNSLSIQGTVTQVTLIPEPLTCVLLAAGVLFLRYRR